MKTNTNTNTKTKIKTILAILLGLTLIVLYNQHKNNQRAEYARINNCTWTVYGSHYICK